MTKREREQRLARILEWAAIESQAIAAMPEEAQPGEGRSGPGAPPKETTAEQELEILRLRSGNGRPRLGYHEIAKRVNRRLGLRDEKRIGWRVVQRVCDQFPELNDPYHNSDQSSRNSPAQKGPRAGEKQAASRNSLRAERPSASSNATPRKGGATPSKRREP